MEECRSNAADYYDRWLAPFRVGQQLCNLALKAAAARRAIPGGLPDHNVAVQSVTEVLA
jgi:hypothetical protein